MRASIIKKHYPHFTLLFLFSTLHNLSLASEQTTPFSNEKTEISESLTDDDDLNIQTSITTDIPEEPIFTSPPIIRDIVIRGNKYVSTEAIRQRIPYKIGEAFNHLKTRELISNLYDGIKRFSNVIVKGKNSNNNEITLIVVVEEKPLIKEVIFEGNKQVSSKDLKEKTKIMEAPAIDEQELQLFVHAIKKLYLEKGFHRVDVSAELKKENETLADAIFTIKEHPKSIVKRVHFRGNKNISGKELRNNIFTREEWLLSFLDKSGSFNPERLEGDRYLIEQYYQNHGYLNAKVVDTDVNIDKDKKNIAITFEVQEGDLFHINEIKAPGNELLSEDYLLSQIPLRPGQIYSKQGIMNAIKRLEWLWGEQGYLFSHIEPSIQPDIDNKSVNLAFYTELGSKVRLNKVTIKGNKKTRDKIIRRKVLLNEGDLVTNYKMDRSKDLVAGMGYFDQQDGVNWKVTRLDDDLADLDLMLKETKTGHFNLKMGYGGVGSQPSSPASGFNVGVDINDTNLFGQGIALTVEGSWAKEEQTITFHLADPWLFDKPLLGAFDAYHRRPTYDEFHSMQPVSEKLTGAALTTGIVTRSRLFDDMQILFSAGLDNIRHEHDKLEFLIGSGTPETDAYRAIACKEFTPGSFFWFTNKFEQDTRNHPMHPSRGQKWQLAARVGVPSFKDDIGFYRIGFDGNWFTPLIGENDLVFRLHGHVGYASPFKNRSIPFSELFHVGGPNSVRGFLYGQIGPHLLGDSIGAKKAFFLNTELIFPITPDFNMKGVVFYDGGAGWDSPYTTAANECLIQNNNFSYRHSVGVGVRILNPMPVRIDWGFKLDPRQDRFDPTRSESASEIHFSMSYDW